MGMGLSIGLGGLGARSRRAGGAAPPALVQETTPIYFRGQGTPNTAALPFDAPSTAGSTLVVHVTTGYFQTIGFSDSAGGSVEGGQWTLETNGDPLGTFVDMQYTWVRRNCPAGLTGVTITSSSSTFEVRVYMREISGLSNSAEIQVVSAVNVASQSSVAIAVSGAGFLSALVRTNPSCTPVSASTGSVVRRMDYFADNVTPYTGAVGEHTLHGLATGARSFNSSWADGAATIGYHGVFIPAA